METKRKQIRQRTFKGGRINFQRRPGMDCIIRNLTDDGACLEIVGPGLVPEDLFDLVIKPECVNRHCQVAWRAGDKVGVKFVAAPQQSLYPLRRKTVLSRA